jgi:GWxTD domain-containing protein
MLTAHRISSLSLLSSVAAFFATLVFLLALLAPEAAHAQFAPSQRPLRLPTLTQQPQSASGSNSASADARTFFVDALCFKGGSDSANASQRVDIYTLVPYTALTFVKRSQSFVAAYTVVLTVKNASGAVVCEVRKEHPIAEEKADVTAGATGGFSALQHTLALPAGSYTLEASVTDMLGRHTMSRSRGFTTVDFSGYDFAMSSVMFASSVLPTLAPPSASSAPVTKADVKADAKADAKAAAAPRAREQRFSITPYLDDDASPFAGESLYTFFETYFTSLTADSLDFVVELLDERKNRAFVTKRERRFVKAERLQHFLKLDIPTTLPVGTYTVRLLALRPDVTMPAAFTGQEVLAGSMRTLKIEWKGLGFGTPLSGDALTRAIRQMRYVAFTQDIAAITAGETEEEQQRRFYEFWKRIDPTPATPRNEAYEEYYTRIDFANLNFRTFGEGWQTDLGMVYVIYGPPSSATERPRIDSRVQMTWFYAQFGREFWFVDNGFSDFRLLSPAAVSEKYRYRR